MLFLFEMFEKRLHHIPNHHSDLKYLSWSLVIYRLEVIVMCLLWVLIGSSGYLSWFWLAILIHLVLVYDTQFRIVHSKSNFLSFIKPVGRFDEYPQLLRVSKQDQPFSLNTKKVKQRTLKFARNKVKLLKGVEGADGKRMTYFSRVPLIKQTCPALLWTRDYRSMAKPISFF